MRFSISVPRSKAMWRALEKIVEEQWQDAQELPDAQVAESTYAPQGWEHEPLRLIIRRVAHPADALSDDPRARRRATIPAEQLNLGLSGEADVVYGYSFILTDLEGEAPAVERHHRERAQIEERIKDQKLGVSLRRLPLSDLDGNRFWLTCTALALNLLGAPERPALRLRPTRSSAASPSSQVAATDAAVRARPGHSPRTAGSACGYPPGSPKPNCSRAPTSTAEGSHHPAPPERAHETANVQP